MFLVDWWYSALASLGKFDEICVCVCCVRGGGVASGSLLLDSRQLGKQHQS